MAEPDHQPQLIDALDRALPQTQCTRCGYPDCRAYATAISLGEAHINQCPPGGELGIQRLAQVLEHHGRPVERAPLNPVNGEETHRSVMWIDEAWCIGCTLCVDACPTDAIIGAPKVMHVIQADACTGCELCIPTCPVSCIQTQPLLDLGTGWANWSAEQALIAQNRYQRKKRRQQRSDARRPVRHSTAKNIAPSGESAPAQQHLLDPACSVTATTDEDLDKKTRLAKILAAAKSKKT